MYRNPNAEPAEEAQERASILAARWTILQDGLILPVTNLFDSDGNRTGNPHEAFSVVAYNEHLTGDKWMMISEIEPGDVWSKSP